MEGKNLNNDSINQRLNNIKKRKISLRQDIISEVKLIEIEKEELKLFKQEIPIKEKNTRRIEKTPVSSIQTIEAPKLKVEEKISKPNTLIIAIEIVIRNILIELNICWKNFQKVMGVNFIQRQR